jgi:hypothetical protein
MAFDKRMEENLPIFLVPLAKFLEIDTSLYRQKSKLCTAILARLAWTSEEDALAFWPVLVQLKATPNEKKALQVALASFNTLLGDIREEAPEYYAHAYNILLDLRNRLFAISNEEQRIAEEAMAPPSWWKFMLRKKPEGGCWKVMLEIDENDHDGYCSEADEDNWYVKKMRTKTIYLPLKDGESKDHDFTKKSWRGKPSCSGGCGCCGTVEVIRLKSAEILE